MRKRRVPDRAGHGGHGLERAVDDGAERSHDPAEGRRQRDVDEQRDLGSRAERPLSDRSIVHSTREVACVYNCSRSARDCGGQGGRTPWKRSGNSRRRCSKTGSRAARRAAATAAGPGQPRGRTLPETGGASRLQRRACSTAIQSTSAADHLLSQSTIRHIAQAAPPSSTLRGPSVIIPSPISFIWRTPIRGTHSSDE